MIPVDRLSIGFVSQWFIEFSQNLASAILPLLSVSLMVLGVVFLALTFCYNAAINDAGGASEIRSSKAKVDEMEISREAFYQIIGVSSLTLIILEKSELENNNIIN